MGDQDRRIDREPSLRARARSAVAVRGRIDADLARYYCPQDNDRLGTGGDQIGVEAWLAGCSTRATTREAMKRAVRTGVPLRVTSVTSTIVLPDVTSTRRPARVATTS